MKGAPVSFVLLLGVGLSTGFVGGLQWRAQEIANAEMLVRATEAQRALSDRQVEEFKSRLRKADPAVVDILGDGVKAEQLKGAFSDSGWQVNMDHAPVDDLVLRAKDNNAAATIQRALKDAGVDYKEIPPNGRGSTDFLLGTEN